ncbi:MAG: helix-turn-helix domain-containing protein [Thaumarchaeota archaeon]|nr:helix-turn-helix domain-containing protein [Nitrososphaerota archaeon]
MVGKAMGNSLRLQILEELVKGPRTLEELSNCTKLKSESILHHIRILQQVGLVEEFEPIRKGGPGRPYSRYKLTGKMVNIQYPQRNYAMLSEILLQQLADPANKKEVKSKFRQIGVATGNAFAKDFSARYGDKKWDIANLRKYFVEEYVKEFGLQPEVIYSDESKLQYRQYNCLFLEVAKKYPSEICAMSEGILDGFLAGIKMPNEFTQTKCLACGDDCCEYIIKAKS